MIRFDRAQLIAFLRAIDRNLARRVKIVMIGGAAATVAYDAEVKTADVDVFTLIEGSEEALSKAADLARRETGLAVSVGAAPVADLPYDYERRLKPIRGLNLKKLKILVPDKYDLVLSKTMRAYPHDIEAVQSISDHHPLAQKTLVARFEKELMNEAIADPHKIALNVAMVVARLYGLDEGRKLAERWKVPVPRKL